MRRVYLLIEKVGLIRIGDRMLWIYNTRFDGSLKREIFAGGHFLRNFDDKNEYEKRFHDQI